MQADLILHNGRVYALGASGRRFCSHLAIAGGRVLAVGGSEVAGLEGHKTLRVDLQGSTLLPGFNDAHAHVVYAGLASFGADLTGCPSIATLLARMRTSARAATGIEWCLGRGYSHLELAEGRHPTRVELDRVTGGRPAFVDERGGHLRVANSAALAAAGITGGTPDPPGGRIGRDQAGAPDGLLYESAMRLVADHQPPPGLDRRKSGILRVQRLLVSRGITSVGAAVNRGFADDLRAYQQLDEEGRLKVRVNQFLSWELIAAVRGLDLRSGFGGGRLRLGPVKVFVDGGLSTEGARLRSGQGLWRTAPDELRELVATAARGGLQVAAHAIGDAAIEAMIAAVERTGSGVLRHRIEHCTICPADLRARAARQGMVAVMQPSAAALRATWEGRFSTALGPDLAAHRALLEAGVSLAFSSDLPVLPDPDPWPGLAAAVLDPAQGIPPLAALRAYTAGGAVASFEEGSKGTLEPGRLADFQVYEQDPVAAGPTMWEGLRPRLVAVGGAPVYRSR